MQFLKPKLVIGNQLIGAQIQFYVHIHCVYFLAFINERNQNKLCVDKAPNFQKKPLQKTWKTISKTTQDQSSSKIRRDQDFCTVLYYTYSKVSTKDVIIIVILIGQHCGEWLALLLHRNKICMCSCPCLSGFLPGIWPPTVQRHAVIWVRLTCDSKLPIGVNVPVNGCLFLYVSPAPHW